KRPSPLFPPRTAATARADLYIAGDCDDARVPSTAFVGVDRLGLVLLLSGRFGRDWTAMAPTKQQILDSLAKVASPDGTPLTKTEALSEVVLSDGKVFFSLTVDAGAVPRWEAVRKRAEEAVRAVPGVQSALVALTAERKPGSAGPASGRPPPRGAGAPRGETA